MHLHAVKEILFLLPYRHHKWSSFHLKMACYFTKNYVAQNSKKILLNRNIASALLTPITNLTRLSIV